MNDELRRTLARRELVRAATYSATFTMPPIFALALSQALKVYLNVPSHLIDETQREFVLSAVERIDGLLHPPHAPSLEEWLRSGRSTTPDFEFAGHTSLHWFTLLSAAAIGARHLADTPGALIVVQLGNRFADHLEPDFPTLAEMLRENHLAENDRVIPPHLLRDAARRRAAHG
jgi:hypothetical protein